MVRFVPYRNEHDIPAIMELVSPSLSEPYSVFTYRYFVHNWPSLTVLAMADDSDEIIGCVVCKVDSDYQGSAPAHLKGIVQPGAPPEPKHGYIG